MKTKKLLAVVGLGLATTSLITGCQPQGRAVAGVGSDTTFDVINQLAASYNTNDDESQGDDVFNVPPTLSGSETYSVPADENCGQQNFNSGDRKPPNGSSAGISALVADGNNACIDFARSSRDRSSSDPSNLEFFAFARDAVSFAAFRNAGCPGGDAAPVGCAPSNLSQAQLRGIYLCDVSTGFGNVPRFTNWNQVGGDNEPIARYLPQTGSGTLSFFETSVLGLTRDQQGVLDDTQCAIRPRRVQENAGDAIASGDRDNAIVPYSYAQFTAQRGGAVPDRRSGIATGSINGVAPNPTTIGNNTFIGTRFVYNVVNSASRSSDRARNFVGVRREGNGFLCEDARDRQDIIARFGFVPLSFAPAGSGLPSSRCRLNPAPL